MQKEDLRKSFEEVYGEAKDLQFYFSPGRINVIGEHIDYNGGLVFPCAITLGTYAAISLRNDNIVRVYSGNIQKDGVIEIKLDEDLTRSGVWADYVKGVITELKKDGFKLDKGFDAYIIGTIPNGASLSSSASLELLFGEIFRELHNLDLTDLDLVKIGKRTENIFMGLHSGIMDQFAVGMSRKDHAVLLDCSTLEYSYAPLVLGDNAILIMNTCKRRELVTSKYNERCAECAEALDLINKNYKEVKFLCELEADELPQIEAIIPNETIYRRVRHVITEMDRVKKTFKALEDNDIALVGKYLDASHKSLKEDYEVTGKELDTIVALAQAQPGVLGARMTGAGFAGCAIAICKKDAVDAVIAKVKEGYLAEIGYGCEIYIAETNNRTTKI